MKFSRGICKKPSNKNNKMTSATQMIRNHKVSQKIKHSHRNINKNLNQEKSLLRNENLGQ